MRLARSELARPDRALIVEARRRRAGVATVEAVILLPVLGLLLVGVLFVRNRYVVHQQVLLEARGCLWQYAVQGCKGELPPRCGDPSLSRSAELAAESERIREASRATTGAQVFEDVPILGDAIEGLLGEKAALDVHAQVPIPWRSREAVRVGGRFALLCNERPRDVMAVATSVLCDHLPVLSCRGNR